MRRTATATNMNTLRVHFAPLENGIVHPSLRTGGIERGCAGNAIPIANAKRMRNGSGRGSFRNNTVSRLYLFIYTRFDTPRLHASSPSAPQRKA
eukprot:6212502-Prymnesium_polylepis.1